MIRLALFMLPGLGLSGLGGFLFVVARRAWVASLPGAAPAWARNVVFVCATLIGLSGLGLLVLGIALAIVT